MHATKAMSLQPIDGSTTMTIITTGFYVGTVILGTVTLQSIAGLAAILAGASTLALNLYRFYREYKDSQNNKKT